jgi:hypothetical protein
VLAESIRSEYTLLVYFKVEIRHMVDPQSVDIESFSSHVYMTQKMRRVNGVEELASSVKNIRKSFLKMRDYQEAFVQCLSHHNKLYSSSLVMVRFHLFISHASPNMVVKVDK